jgi:pimeloyl-ACP methyl ester carboxylesterase
MTLPDYEAGYLTEQDGARKPYVRFGTGSAGMVIVPGAADGLRTCVDVALFLAWFYRERAAEFRILILSRREPLPEKFGMQRHAEDMIRSVETLEFGPAVWECLSAAGPIGQHVAVVRPDLVRGLVLSSSYDYATERTRQVLNQWLQIAEHPESLDLFSQSLAEKYRPPREIVNSAGICIDQAPREPTDPTRLRRILQELLQLDQRDMTPRITCPTLVIAGEDDRVVPISAQRELALRIATSRLQLCPGFGHFNDMENPEYQTLVEQFAREVGPSR